jgi:uncharacterized membrane protein
MSGEIARVVYLGSVFLHILAALVWLGGMLFLAIVAVPAARRLPDPRLRSALLADVGSRFRAVGWPVIGVLVVTGAWNAGSRWGWSSLVAPAFWDSRPGQLLGLKLLFVAAMVALSGLHDFVLGPRLTALGRAAPDAPGLAGLRKRTVTLARLEVMLGLAVVALAVAMIR